MSPVRRALWYVESHARQPIALDQISEASGVTPYHLSRAFAAIVGLPPMRYVRRRRLSEAAKRLAGGAPDILTVALDHGYTSHEGFSRAFKDLFSVTPEAVRASGVTTDLELQELFVMSDNPQLRLAPPTLETVGPLRLVGLVEPHPSGHPIGIPDQWQRFMPHFAALGPQMADRYAYGACDAFDEERGTFDYLCGVAVRGSVDPTGGLAEWTIPQQTYAVFHHAGHIAEIGAVMSAIWETGLPDSGHEPQPGPTLERYGPEFDGATGTGGYEILIPVR